MEDYLRCREDEESFVWHAVRPEAFRDWSPGSGVVALCERMTIVFSEQAWPTSEEVAAAYLLVSPVFYTEDAVSNLLCARCASIVIGQILRSRAQREAVPL